MSALHFIPLTSTSSSFLGTTKCVASPPSPVLCSCSAGSCCLSTVAPATMGSSRLKAELNEVSSPLLEGQAEVDEPMPD